jgi:HTH-type transcriptional regulator/antitoxin HigA
MISGANEMSSSVIGKEKYIAALSRLCPQRIRTDTEYRMRLQQVEEIMLKGKAITPEERECLDLITMLISAYEQERYAIKNASPLQVLKFLMEQHQHTAKDLWQLFDKSIVSKILNEQRGITIDQAKVLGDFYKIGFKAFVG